MAFPLKIYIYIYIGLIASDLVKHVSLTNLTKYLLLHYLFILVQATRYLLKNTKPNWGKETSFISNE